MFERNSFRLQLYCYTIIILMLISCSSSRVDQRKFENLYRTTKSVQGALMTGVTYIRFGELLQTMGTELLLVKDKVTNDREKDLLTQYAEIYELYKNSYELWGHNIQESVKLQSLRDYTKKYGIEMSDEPYWGEISEKQKEVMQYLWNDASAGINKLVTTQ